MVFFACNHCGASVKKGAVETHYLRKCRGAPINISCMDCQKDFQDNYVEHTKCISELEKYSAKGFVPKNSIKKNEKKQEGWTEVVRSVLDAKDQILSRSIREAFVTLQSYENIPRKKNKFLNFVSNSVHLSKSSAEEVWDILEKELEKMKQAKQVNQQSKENGTDEAKATNKDEGANDKKSKKDNTTDGVTKAESDCVVENGKKRKKYKETQPEIVANGYSNIENGEMKEKSKKKKKKEKDAEKIESMQGIATDQDEVGSSKKKKMKHKVETEISESIDAEVPAKRTKKAIDKDDENSEKDESNKKKKHKLEKNGLNGEEPDRKKQKTEQVRAEEQNEAKELNVFCWDTELGRIIGKHPEGIKLEKLKKKLLKKYTRQPELTERQQKNFDKKLTKKLKNNTEIQVEGDLIKACS